MATCTLPHVALRLACTGCHDGPDEVWLTASVHGLDAPHGGGDLTWIMPLVQRQGGRAKRLRRRRV